MSLIDRFMTGEYTVKRATPGTYLKGRYQAGDPETITVRGSLQPTNARELKLPEEGARLKQYFKFYSDAPVLTIDTRNLSRADVVEINGETFKVWSVESWAGTKLPYFMSILYREAEQ